MARAKALLAHDPLRRWTAADANDTYNIPRWGCGYFGVNDQGNLIVTPRGEGQRRDRHEGADRRARRARHPAADPAPLQRHPAARIELLCGAFNGAIKEYGYSGQYRGVYPIKVNQNRTVVEEIIEYGRPFHYGLEAGSKPELLAIMAIHQDDEALIICNGYKDEEYIETALLASKMGKTVILVVEKPTELDNIHRVSERVKIKPQLGIRARLSSRGAGRWEQSGGDFSKFGLSAAEMVEAVDKLKAWGELDTLKLLHFHLGSQISRDQERQERAARGGPAVRRAVQARREGPVVPRRRRRARRRLRRLADQLRVVDELHGAGVRERRRLRDQGDLRRRPGAAPEHRQRVGPRDRRAPLGARRQRARRDRVQHARARRSSPKPAPPLVTNMWETYQGVSQKNLLESYHDAVEYKDQVLQLFNLGHLSLEHRVLCENLFWAICEKVLMTRRATRRTCPRSSRASRRRCRDTYFCNFSMFQSVPDAWAVDQLFPICPIHRLNEEPTRRATLADITCDSDGKIDSFIDLRDVKHVLELHPKHEGQDYYLGIFLVGAYQEILGDLHNLFGDTNTVHVQLSPEGDYDVKEVVAGDTVSEVLQFVDYSPSDLLGRMRNNVEQALRKKLMTIEESRTLINRFRQGMIGYTYLDRE